MRFIAHRGNWRGKGAHEWKENHPFLIDAALDLGYDVEVDLWHLDDKLWLGHDGPEFEIEKEFLSARRNNLWIHCKNVSAMNYLRESLGMYVYFSHDKDVVALTSKGCFWHYPTPFRSNWRPWSIVVMPEWYPGTPISRDVYGICSDRAEYYYGEHKNKNSKVFQ